ncbi:hypothetical protein Barb6XT_00462 [Bacteroidales bacterium Barb6XT]|nr:hypothetical protein Barb6XT_00462 [Bacteroidales bacterium Barb6XT]
MYINKVLKERYKMQHIIYRLFFQNSLVGVVLITPHSALLHLGLKSFDPSGHLRNEGIHTSRNTVN